MTVKNYIFITRDGNALAPNNEHIENCQVLGFEEGENGQQALEKLKQNNDWISKAGYEDVVFYELVKEKPVYNDLYKE